jgi:DNA-binding HxlR family transcriptional regulator
VTIRRHGTGHNGKLSAMPGDLPDLDHAAGRIGDRWALLLVGALLGGPRRFGELQAELAGVAPNILAKRLRALEAEGLVVATPYSTRPLRVAYGLTASGSALADALRLLAQWAAEHPGPRSSPSSARTEPLHHPACGTAVEARWWCPTCEELVEGEDVTDVRWV